MERSQRVREGTGNTAETGEPEERGIGGKEDKSRQLPT